MYTKKRKFILRFGNRDDKQILKGISFQIRRTYTYISDYVISSATHITREKIQFDLQHEQHSILFILSLLLHGINLYEKHSFATYLVKVK